MRLRHFTAATTAEALKKVKQALGDEALVLGTRTSPGGEVEITAAVDVDEVTAPLAPTRPGTDGFCEPRRDGRGETGLDAALLYRLLDRLGARVRRMDRVLQAVGGGRAVLGPVAREIADRLGMSGLAPHLVDPIGETFERALASGRARGEALRASLLEHLPVARAAAPTRVTAFVGPTGSGKTTTIAKLAAAAVASGAAPPGLVMADTFRVGAAEQLGAFARLLGAPMNAVGDPREMHEAIAALADCESVLVDTGGLAGDDESWREVAALLDAAGDPVGVVVVVSAAMSSACLERAWRRLSHFAPGSCVITKVDECDGPGDACTWAAEVGVPLRWLGTGPRVPGDLVAADGESLVRWLLAA